MDAINELSWHAKRYYNHNKQVYQSEEFILH